MVSGVQRWNARMETVDEGYAAWNMSDFPALGQEISSPNANTAKGRALPTHSQCIATHSDTVRSDPEDTPSHRDERGQSDDMREIARILAEMEATEETRAKHREFIARLEGIVKWWCGREARLDPFGSTVAGFATKESDLDLTLNPCRDKAYTGEEKRELLKNLSKHFRFRCHLKSFAVLSARVPVIQLTDPATGVCADLSLQNDLPVYKSQMFKNYAAIDFRFRPLILLVKAWAKARGINSAPQGTLNSFGYSVLVLHFLQRVEPPILPVLTSPLLQLRGRARQRALAAGLPAELSLPGHSLRSMSGVQFEYHLHAARILEGWGSDNPASVAELFASFFEYYAAFDFEQRVVPAFAPGEPLIKDEVEFYTNQGSALCLQDPLDPHDNVSRNVGTSAAERIRGELSRAHRLVCEVGLKSVLTEICQAPSKNQRRGQRKEERLRQKALEEEQNAAQS